MIGIGIAKENIDHLFGAFQQATPEISKEYGGTGLGLWITKSIVQKMGGDITVESQPGNGTNFYFAFPAKLSEPKPMIFGNFDINLSKNKFKGTYNIYIYIYNLGLKCLYVENNQESQIVMEHLLTTLGFKTLMSSTGLEGLDIFKRKRPNYFSLIITNLRMPIMSGQEMLLEIRNFEHENHRKLTPIFGLTDDCSKNERIKILNILGANEVLTIPIDTKILIDKLSNLLKDGNFPFIEEDSDDDFLKNNRRNKYVYVIDDDDMASFVLKQLLQKEGYKVLQAYNEKQVFIIEIYIYIYIYI